VLLPEERRDDRDPGHRNGDQAADHAAEAERGGLEEPRAREALDLALVRERQRESRLGRGARAHRRRRLPVQVGAAGDVAHPEEAEDERDHGADRGHEPTHDDSRQEDGNADGEPDRPEARRRRMRLTLRTVLLHQLD
jgi:hypothetical protein